MKARRNVYYIYWREYRLFPASRSLLSSGEAFPLDGEGSLRNWALCWDHCTLGWKLCHAAATASSFFSLGLCLQLFPRGWQATLDESETCLTADFTARVSFQPGSSSAPLSWWRALRALGLSFLIYCWGLLGCHTVTDLHPWREVAHLLEDIPCSWIVENTSRVTLLTLAIKRILQSLCKGNHVWVTTSESVLLWGKKALQEKNIVVRFMDLRVRRHCEIIWSGLCITFLFATSTLTAWHE